MKEVGGPQVSPDGKWIAYTVTSMDREADKLRSAIWMVNWEGTQDYQVTRGPDSDTSPRWSPDGRYLAFLSARPAEGKSQIWLIDRRGGGTSMSDPGEDATATFDQLVDDEIALKLISPEIAADRRTLEQFSRELKIARRVVHKNVGQFIKNWRYGILLARSHPDRKIEWFFNNRFLQKLGETPEYEFRETIKWSGKWEVLIHP